MTRHRSARSLPTVLLALMTAASACARGGGAAGSATESAASGVPAERSAYIGDWQGEGVTFSLAADGAISYEKKTGAVSRALSGRLAGFAGDDIKVKVLLVGTTLKVQRPPRTVDGVPTMILEGATVTRRPPVTGLRAAAERVLREGYLSKGVKVQRVVCPPEAETATTFSCLLTEEQETLPIRATLRGEDISFSPESAALLDRKRLESFIRADFARQRLAARVQCGESAILLRAVGSTFDCAAQVPRVTGDVPVAVQVVDEAGNVRVRWRATPRRHRAS